MSQDFMKLLTLVIPQDFNWFVIVVTFLQSQFGILINFQICGSATKLNSEWDNISHSLSNLERNIVSSCLVSVFIKAVVVVLVEFFLQFIKVSGEVVFSVIFSAVFRFFLVPVLTESFTSVVKLYEFLKSVMSAAHSVIQPGNGKFFNQNSD